MKSTMLLSAMSLTGLLFGQIVTEAVAQSCPLDQEQKLIDNGNTAACDTTQTARFSLQYSAMINSMSVWYNTDIGGRSLRFALSGPVSLNGTMQAVSCDPYQSQWCVGEIQLGQKFVPGDYVITTEQKAVCQNVGSEGNGFVALKGCIISSCPLDKEQKLIDNGNTAACDTTQTARFSLQYSAMINSMSVWYNTDIGGRSLRFALSGPVSLNGTMQAVSCDPYQSQWCVGEIQLGQKFVPGDYVITTEQKAICQNVVSEGNGFVALKGCIVSDNKIATPMPYLNILLLRK